MAKAKDKFVLYDTKGKRCVSPIIKGTLAEVRDHFLRYYVTVGSWEQNYKNRQKNEAVRKKNWIIRKVKVIYGEEFSLADSVTQNAG